MYKATAQEEESQIIGKYRQLLHYSNIKDPAKRKLIKKAYYFAVEAHKDMRRKSGEPYVFHPIEVALIATREIGLGSTSIICALLHDVVEDTDYTLKDIELMFGKKVASIIDGLTKISGIWDESGSQQAENFRKVLLTLADDVRVILIKIADRLHNMRTLDSMPHEKQLKIASETSYLYAPLAHRLGLFSIKSELEDLSLKYKEPEAYHIISSKIESSEIDRKRFINKFLHPIKQVLNRHGIKYRVLSRTKAISSIWNKMQTKKVDFEEIYDLFAIRFILDGDIQTEKENCWRVYSLITDIYIPKQDRFRDWISMPKANGYESLHTTVMSKEGKWVEIQIRSNRMDEIAEKGYAAHWKYKGQTKSESGLDEWLSKIREVLQNPTADALDFLDDFKLNLFSEEIYAFTPKGEIRTLPKGATVIDFAFSIHSAIGKNAIGAKINNRLVPLSHVLNSGDQVEILTSTKQIPKEEWFDMATTARAKSQIKQAVKEEKKKFGPIGKKRLFEIFTQFEINNTQENLKDFQNHIGIASGSDFLYKIAIGKIDENDVKDWMLKKEKENPSWLSYLNPFSRLKFRKDSDQVSSIIYEKLQSSPESLLLSEKTNIKDFRLAACCNPINGDNVVGFIDADNIINIHRTECKEASRLMSTYGNSIVKTKWRDKGNVEFLTGIKIFGYDKIGLLLEITEVITSEHNINIRSFNIQSSEGLSEGIAMLYVTDTKQLDNIIARLKLIKGIEKVFRI